MNWYDIVLIVVIAVSFLYGLIKGIISEVFALFAIVIGFIIAMKFSFLIEPHILPFVKKDIFALIVSFILLFLLSASVIILIGMFFKKAIKLVHLSWLDRIIGGIFGVIKGVIVAGLISLLIFLFFPGGKTLIKKSTLGRRAVNIVKIAVFLLPEKVQKKLDSK